MGTQLHDPLALRDLATTAEGAAQDWARTRLALWAPEHFELFPAGDIVNDALLGAAPEGIERALLLALETAEAPTEGLAAAVASASLWGLRLDRERTVQACVEALKRAPAAAAPWLSYALAQRDALDKDALVAAAASRTPTARWLVPALAVRFAGSSADATASQVCAQLDSADLQHAFLVALGASNDLRPGRMDPDDAVRWGSGRAGGMPVERTPPRGSRKHRARGWVHTLLEGDDSPLAAGLRAIAQLKLHPKLTASVVAQASWMSSYEPLDPVVDVVARYAGQRSETLITARAAVTSNEVETIKRAITHGNHGAAVLGLATDRSAVADAVLTQALNTPELGWISAAAALAPCLQDRVPELLTDRATRRVGLSLAELTPTLEVLQTLLSMKVPADATSRRAYGAALAGMGDPVASQHVHALAAHEPEGAYEHAVSLCASLGHSA